MQDTPPPPRRVCSKKVNSNSKSSSNKDRERSRRRSRRRYALMDEKVLNISQYRPIPLACTTNVYKHNRSKTQNSINYMNSKMNIEELSKNTAIPTTITTTRIVDIRPLKAYAITFPKILKDVILCESDNLTVESFLAKMETWLSIAKLCDDGRVRNKEDEGG